MMISFLVFIIGFVCHAFALFWVTTKCNHCYTNNKTEIYDVIINNTNFKTLSSAQQNTLIFLRDMIPFCVLLFLVNITRRKGLFDTFISQLFWFAGILMILKSVCCSLTVLPHPDMDISCCQNKLGIMDVIKGKNCGDLIFSLHTSITLTMCLIAAKLNMMSYNAAYIITVIVGGLMIYTRGHYTIDVVIGIFVSYLIFENYSYRYDYI